MPLEQTGNAVIFYAFYTNNGTGATGLTVTADVWEVATDGTATEIASAQAATEIGDGLYCYRVAGASIDTEGEYIAVFKTADTVDQQHIAALWVINRAGIENLDGAISAVPGGVWSYAVRTLTQSAASVIAAVEGSVISVYQYNTWNFSLTGLGDITGRAELYFTAKENVERADASAQTILQVEETAGLIYIGGEKAANPALGTLTVDDAALGNITIKVDETVTGIPSMDGRYDVKMITAAGDAQILTISVFEVLEAVTRTV